MTFDHFKEDLLVALGLREPSIYDLTEKKPFLCSIGEVTHRKNSGFSLTGKPEFLEMDLSTKNVAITGVSGTFKSQAILIPNLLYEQSIQNQSLIVHDASKELAEQSAGFHQQLNRRTIIINPLDENSPGYNPLTLMKPGLASAKQVAQVIVAASLGTSGGDNIFWTNRAEAVTACLLAITKCLPDEYCHIGTVTYILSQLSINPRGVDAFVIKHVKDRKIIEAYKADIVAVEPKLFGNILATVNACLSVFQDETVAKVLSRNDVDITSIRKHPTTIYLVSSVMKSTYTAPVFSLMLHQFMEYLLSYIPDPKTELPVKLLIDEFPILVIPGFQQFIANSRKHFVSTLISIQSKDQVFDKFGHERGRAILGNCSTHVFFTNAPYESAEGISKACGMADFPTDTGTVTKALFSAQEVRLLPKDRILILTPGHRPILAHILPAFKNRKLNKRIGLPYKQTPPVSQKLTLLPDIPIVKPSNNPNNGKG